MVLSVLFGFGVQMGYESNIMYVRHCAVNHNASIRERKEDKYMEIY